MTTLRESVSGMWGGMDRGMKFVFAGAVTIIVAALVWGIYVVAHEDYRTLFSQLSDSDAAAIVDALKKQKVPYRLAEDGRTIEVPADRVHETRLALMSSNVALSGGVGFEIFDKQGLGATEQSQRVSFQRALQGELARTISTLEGVKQARVHLVLPESSLFKRDKQEATAAVTLTMKPGNTLDRQQIMGVQRLVAASVAGLDPSHVIITDQRGVTLSRAEAVNGGIGGVEARLELQREIENHIAQKISRMLDSAFGPGQAIISVAVALSFDAVKTTTQDVLPVHSLSGTPDQGIVRKRQIVSGGNQDGAAVSYADGTGIARNTTSTLEVEYEHGRRVEEVIAAPGAVRRITVGVIVPPRIEEEQQKRIREFVRVAAGIDETRGDLISIESLGTNDRPPKTEAPASADAPQANAAPPADALDADKRIESSMVELPSTQVMIELALVVLLLATVIGLIAARAARRPLSEKDRSELLSEIRRALGDDGRVVQMQVKQ